MGGSDHEPSAKKRESSVDNIGGDESSDCDRCDSDAEHLVILQADYLRAHRDRRPLCDDCLEELGEWW